MNGLSSLRAGAALLAVGVFLPNGASGFFDNFNDDAGDLTGRMAVSGQTWTNSTKAETGGRSLATGITFGQGGTVGAGDEEAGSPKVWKGNMVALGQQLGNTPGTWTLSADQRKYHAGGGSNHELDLILKSSTQSGNETIVTYRNDRLTTGGNWFSGADLGVAFGTPASIHVDLVLELAAGGGTNSATLSWFEIGNESNNGSVALGTVTGTLLFDEIHLLTFTQNSLEVGFDNLFLDNTIEVQVDIGTTTAAEISWDGQAGRTYQPQYTEDLVTSNAWFNLGPEVLGSGGTNSVLDSTENATVRAYRVLQFQ